MCRVKTNQPDARYINPMTDFGFKKVFGDPDVMKAFLMDLLKPESPITQITFHRQDHMETIQTQLPFVNKKPIFQRISDIAEIAKMPSKEREAYRQSLDAFRTNVASYAWERAQGHDEGHEEGLAEGLEKGRAEGLEKGREEGRKEEKRATARNLKNLGFPIESIAQATGLSVEEVILL